MRRGRGPRSRAAPRRSRRSTASRRCTTPTPRCSPIPSIDAIYNPLPNGLHAEWTIAALEAGKHVLCEKPFTANAKEAEAVAAVATRTGLVVMEAFHYRYHPLAQRMREIVESGELGTIRRVETALCFPLPKFSDIRYQYDLAGGATMDVGTLHRAHGAPARLRGTRGRVGRRPSCARPTSIGRCAPSWRSRAGTPVGSPARCGRAGSSRRTPASPATAASCT